MNQMVRPAQIEKATPFEALAGTIERVTFHNEENGFCVLKVQTRGKRDLVTVIGHAPAIGAGEWITATGVWVVTVCTGFSSRPTCSRPRPRPGLRGSSG